MLRITSAFCKQFRKHSYTNIYAAVVGGSCCGAEVKNVQRISVYTVFPFVLRGGHHHRAGSVDLCPAAVFSPGLPHQMLETGQRSARGSQTEPLQA